MLILQAILSLIFLIFAEKSKTHSDAFENASYPSHSKNLDANQGSLRLWMKITPSPFTIFSKTNLSNIIWTNFGIITFLSIFLMLRTLSLGKNIRIFNCFELRKTEFISSKFCLQCYLFVTFTSTYILKYSVYNV